MEGATTLALCLKQTSIVAIVEAVVLQITRDFSKRGALMLIAILKMIRPVHLLVLEELITRLSFALEERTRILLLIVMHAPTASI